MTANRKVVRTFFIGAYPFSPEKTPGLTGPDLRIDSLGRPTKPSTLNVLRELSNGGTTVTTLGMIRTIC